LKEKLLEIAGKLLSAISEGRPPWRRDWKSAAGSMWPVNAVSKKPYRGMNAAILLSVMNERGWPGLFLTFRQALAAGGSVRKGEHGFTGFFYRPMLSLPRPVGGKTLWAEGDARLHAVLGTEQLPAGTKRVPMLTSFTLFNIRQCDGLAKFEEAQAAAGVPSHQDPAALNEAAERLIETCASRLDGGINACPGGRAFYDVVSDRIVLPERDQFETVHGFYACALHELSHATGHPTRLDRQMGNKHGSVAYCLEEVIAESSAAFITSQLGIPYIEQHEAYVADWGRAIAALPDGPQRLASALAAGARAADMVLRGMTAASDTEPAEETQ
jgi:antirestriction protein ArdC